MSVPLPERFVWLAVRALTCLLFRNDSDLLAVSPKQHEVAEGLWFSSQSSQSSSRRSVITSNSNPEFGISLPLSPSVGKEELRG